MAHLSKTLAIGSSPGLPNTMPEAIYKPLAKAVLNLDGFIPKSLAFIPGRYNKRLSEECFCIFCKSL